MPTQVAEITTQLNQAKTKCAELKMPSTASMVKSNDEILISSNDPKVIGLEDTPTPVICEFCGAERHAVGLNYAVGIDTKECKIIWLGTAPCTCPKGIAEYNRIQAETKAKAEAEEKTKAKKQADMLMKRRISTAITGCCMSEKNLRMTFETFEAETADQKKIKATAKAYANNFESKLPKHNEPLQGKNGYIFTGSQGMGKTHISSAIANDLISRGISVICMTERNLYDNIKRTYSLYGELNDYEVRGVYETVPLLIIDDLGKEKPTEWTLSTLYSIIDGRYNRLMPIIMTSNYTPRELKDKLTPVGMDNKTASAIMDRIAEMCEGIQMNGESWRIR